MQEKFILFYLEEEKEIKLVFKKHYWIIKEIFKYQSAIGTSVGSTPFAIPLNVYTDFIRNAGVIDGKEMSISESDTLHITINKRTKVTPLIPGNALVRYQFLEILLRIGLKRESQIKSLGKRVDSFLNKFILNNERNVKIVKAQDFRWENYWNEPVDNLLKFHVKLLQEIYNGYSGKFKKPGEENFMAPAEFEKIFNDSGLQNERFANRDINVCFNLAMQTRVDEYTADKHLKMSFIEFLEAISRAADYLSYPPPSYESKFGYMKKLSLKEKFNAEENKEEAEGDEEIEMTEEELISQPLSKKIENILPILLMFCTKRIFKKKWIWPTKNPKYGLYEEPRTAQAPKNMTELKKTMTIGLNKLIFNKMNFKELLEKKRNGKI